MPRHTVLCTNRRLVRRPSATEAAVVTDEKHILASRYKTKLCKNFVRTGECPYEARCMFAHGEKELRTSDENIRDGLVTEDDIKAAQRQLQQQHQRRRLQPGSSTNPSSLGSHKQPNPGAVAYESPDDMGTYDGGAAEPTSRCGDANYNSFPDAPMDVYCHRPYALNILAPESRLYTHQSAAYSCYTMAPYDVHPASAHEFFPMMDDTAPMVPNTIAYGMPLMRSPNARGIPVITSSTGIMSTSNSCTNDESSEHTNVRPVAMKRCVVPDGLLSEEAGILVP